MKFEDRSFVRSLQVVEDGVSGIDLSWSSPGMANMETKGFLVCYRSGATREQCRAAVEALTDEQLLQALTVCRPLTEMRPGADMLICTAGQHAGMHLLNDFFPAPSVIEVWAVLYHADSGTLFVCNHADADNSYTRRLRLMVSKESRIIGGGGRQRVGTGTVIRVINPDRSACYSDGMLEYRLGMAPWQQRYPYPIAAAAIGRELCFPEIPPEYIQVTVSEEFRDMCRLEYC